MLIAKGLTVTNEFSQPSVDRSNFLPFQYGGDIAANVLLAASSIVPTTSKKRPMVSSVEYISAGDPTKPRTYVVEKLRESGKFVHTLVTLKQQKIIATGKCVFHADEHNEKSLEYFPRFPSNCSSADSLETVPVLLEKMKKQYVLEKWEFV